MAVSLHDHEFLPSLSFRNRKNVAKAAQVVNVNCVRGEYTETVCATINHTQGYVYTSELYGRRYEWHSKDFYTGSMIHCDGELIVHVVL